MSEETIHESSRTRSRRAIATYFRRVADALGRGEPVAVDEAGTVTVEPPADLELEIELEREEGDLEFEVEMKWPEETGVLDTETTASKATAELYEDAGGDHRWRLVHDNGNIIADCSEGYASGQKARQGLDSVRRNAPGAYVVDLSKDDEPDAEGGSDATFELYEDKQGKYRWRLVHDNGNILSDSGQGYASKQKARQGLESVRKNVPGAPTERVED